MILSIDGSFFCNYNIDRNTKEEKDMKNATSVSLTVMLLAGILFLIFPGGSLHVAVRILGIGLILAGVISAGNEIAKKVDKSDIKLIGFLVEILAGIVLLAAPNFVLNAFPFIAGLIILVMGIVDVVRAVQVLLETVDGWKMHVALAALTVIVGIIIMINPFGSLKLAVRVIGVILIYHAVTGILVSRKLPET